YNCNELFEIIFACSKIGAIFVPINSRFIGREIKHVLDNSEASVLIYDIRFLSEVEKALAEDTSVKKSVTVGGGAQGSYEYESMIAEQSVEEPEPDVPLVESDHICYLYTG